MKPEIGSKNSGSRIAMIATTTAAAFESHGGTVGAEQLDGRIRIWFSLPLDGPRA
jgi:hypothetical protein